MDKAPLLFQVRLGGLFPANAAAETALREIKGKVRCEIKGGVANQRRRSLYWAVAALVVPILNDLHGMTLNEDDLHWITRDKLNLGERFILPSGQPYFKPRSTSNRAMNEADRAAFTDAALNLWSAWVGIDVTTLRDEALAA